MLDAAHEIRRIADANMPDGAMVVFADHDRANLDPGNLVLVPRALWATIQRLGVDYYDRESLETAVNIARLVQARHSAQCRPRPCGCCGREFEQRYPRQRTCDSCLEAGKRAPRRKAAESGR